MGSIPSNISRVPTFLASRISLDGLNRTNLSLVRLQEQLSSGLLVNRPSDNPISASLIGVIDQDLETADQRFRNYTHAGGVLATIDSELGSLSDLVLDAKEISSSQLGAGSDAVTRSQQAGIVTSLIDQLLFSVNSEFGDISVFSGGRTGVQALESFRGGFRYNGDDAGLFTDLGPGLNFPITLSADEAVGSLSTRVEGTVDLNPNLTAKTRLTDLRGPTNDIAQLGSMAITVDVAGTPTELTVDLSQAQSVGDIANIIESEIRTNGPAGALAGAFPGGVTFTGDRFQVNVGGPTVSITFDAVAATPGETARTLGLDGFTFDNANATNPDVAVDLDPRVTPRTTLGDLNPATPLDFGDIVFRNGDRVGTVTIDPAMSVADLQEAVERLDLGLRVEISDNGSGIDVINEVSGLRASVYEGGGTAASTLGVRTFDGVTELGVFNDGRGVEIADGATDPVTGLPDPDRNVDFEITLSDGTSFQVDLLPTDAQSVQTVLDAINAAATAAGVTVGTGPGEFIAGLDTGSGGIALEDRLGGPDPVRVNTLNGFAAEDLGLLDGQATTGIPARLVGEDRATVRVDSLLTTLIDLRNALDGDDSRGITFAGGRLEEDLERLASARALVGGRVARIEEAELRLEDRVLLDTQVKSELQDLDFIEGSSRFTNLQTQLQASLTTAAQISRLSLLNFL